MAIYLDIPSIRGNSKNTGHIGQIEALSFEAGTYGGRHAGGSGGIAYSGIDSFEVVIDYYDETNAASRLAHIVAGGNKIIPAMSILSEPDVSGGNKGSSCSYRLTEALPLTYSLVQTNTINDFGSKLKILVAQIEFNFASAQFFYGK